MTISASTTQATEPKLPPGDLGTCEGEAGAGMTGTTVKATKPTCSVCNRKVLQSQAVLYTNTAGGERSYQHVACLRQAAADSKVTARAEAQP
jgi:hypothetical protein